MGVDMEMRDVAVVMWRQRLIVVLVLLFGALLILGGLAVAPRTYESRATVAVVKAPTSAIELAEIDALREAMAASVQRPSLLLRVRAELDVDRSVTDLSRAVRGRAVGGLPIVMVIVEDRDGAVATRIAGLVAAALVESQADSSQVDATVVAPASPATVVDRPSFAAMIGGGLTATVVLAALVAIGRERRSESLSTAMDVENAAVAPLLADLRAPGDLTTMPTLRPGSEGAQEFHALAARLAPPPEREGWRTLVVTGVRAGELDVWLGANLAIAEATGGGRVLLVDGRLQDAARPAAAAMTAAPDTPGLADVLQGVDLVQAISAGPVETLSVLPAGPPVENPGDLVRGRFGEVIGEAAARFDRVVVLAPDVGLVEDTAAMVARARVVLVVPHRGASPGALRASVTRLRAAGGRILGVVMVEHDHDHAPAYRDPARL